ncbi:MAG: hypothetical protein JRJ84_19145, partial [Deltaproteobacteria bacterium]|nr:hypothetical protein [Deltaproteobacteria bacterium]
MSAPLNASMGALFVGLVSGGLLGTFRYQELENRRPLCGTCHHGASEVADAADRIPPHSLDFGASCHVCHVLPLREYAAFWLGSTERTPEWENPIVGGQTCLECHLLRSRGTLPCEGCHSEVLEGVRLTDKCQTCHLDRELVPPHHGHAVCRDCHLPRPPGAGPEHHGGEARRGPATAAGAKHARTEPASGGRRTLMLFLDEHWKERQRADLKRALERRRVGTRWGMYIDPARCTGCRACQ